MMVKFKRALLISDKIKVISVQIILNDCTVMHKYHPQKWDPKKKKMNREY